MADPDRGAGGGGGGTGMSLRRDDAPPLDAPAAASPATAPVAPSPSPSPAAASPATAPVAPAPSPSPAAAGEGRGEGRSAPPTPTAPAPSPSPGPRHLGDFTLVREVGRGSMGIVYEAVQRSINRRVALKMLPPGLAGDPGFRSRFVREAESLGRLEHPGIVSVYGSGAAEDCPYYAMEFIEGRSLDDVMKKEKVTFARAAWLALQVAEGLDHAHAHGIVHRDIKPSNLLLVRAVEAPRPGDELSSGRRGATNVASWRPGRSGFLPTHDPEDFAERLKITDFGLALAGEESRMTHSGVIVGTPAYMSPEQAAGRSVRIDGRTDLYSLGVILYEILAGRLPFDAQDASVLILKIRELDPTSPREINRLVPPDLETIVMKCLEKHPHRRYATGAELADDLRRFLEGEPILARPLGAGERTWRWLRKHRAWAAALGSSALLFAVFGSYLANERVTRRREIREAMASAAASQRGGRYGEAARLYNRVIGLDPTHHEAVIRARECEMWELATDAGSRAGIIAQRALPLRAQGQLLASAGASLARVVRQSVAGAAGRLAAGDAAGGIEAQRTARGPEFDAALVEAHELLNQVSTPDAAALAAQMEGWQSAGAAPLAEVADSARAAFESSQRAHTAVLALMPDDPPVRRALAETYAALWLMADAEGEGRGNASYRELARAFDAGGALTGALEGRGALGVESTPAGARVGLAPLAAEAGSGRLSPGPEEEKGATPVALLELPRGRWRVTLRAAGCADLVETVVNRGGESLRLAPRLLRADQVPAGFVYVPAGSCVAGSAGWRGASARLLRRAEVSGFFIGVREVSAGEYGEFLKALGARDTAAAARWAPLPAAGAPVDDAAPVTGVSAEAADAYCRWRSTAAGGTVRLPTVDEWDTAARGGDGRRSAWGDAAPGGGAADESPYGALDLFGGVAEWTASTAGEGMRSVRGGAAGEADARGARRADERDPAIGFRVVMELPR
ncbi:MAG: protein kinase [Planctomycetes bacterium]|nr:protein kinase [Planctomycetota bacterium]